MKNCNLAWPDHSSLRALSLSAYALKRGLASLALPAFFLRTARPRNTKIARSAGKRAGHTKL